MTDKPVQLKITQTLWTNLELTAPRGRDRLEWMREQLPTATRFEFEQACGHKVAYEFEDLPLVDTPCPCGAEGCWIVKWSEAEGEKP